MVVFAETPSLAKNGGRLSLAWPSEQGGSYRIQRSKDFGSRWEYVGTLFSDTGEILTQEIDWGDMKQAWFRLFGFRK